MIKVLVTGNSGSIGFDVACRFIKSGDTVLTLAANLRFTIVRQVSVWDT